ncbi:winged helix-turn-helix domain-containing protein [Micromonospora sp. CPCC 206061]|uniref:winged helix-turn-helix domain-containing protein n=1 Tax=Micromonospora sp. CPCC 206061 TaxID=3122410 RepID=UPI002FF3B17D
MSEEMTARSAKALRALAHPLRWKLIDLVGREETATATRCADELGESVASCSYHLNILAKYGFVEQAPSGPGREKPWRLTSFNQNLSGEGLGVDGELAAQAATEVFLDHELNRMKERLRRQALEPAEWRDAVSFAGVTTALTAEELREVTAALSEVAQRFARRASDRGAIPAGAREVRIFFSTSVAPPPKTSRGGAE